MQKLATKTAFFCSAAALAMLTASSASAADLPAATAYKAPIAARTPLVDWTGFYIGGHINESWARNSGTTYDTTTGGALSTGSDSQSKFHGGGQIGYDYMLPSRFVVGVLADVNSGSSSSSTFSNHTDSSKTNVSGTVRARLGYAFSSFLLYGTGGWAWSTGSATRTQTAAPLTGTTVIGTTETTDVNRNGWTLGAGLAWAAAAHWNVYGEYRYTDYGSSTVTFPVAQRSTTNSTTANLLELGVNYKF